MINTTTQCVVSKNHVARSKVKVTARSLSLCIPETCPTITSFQKLVRFENYLAEMIITTRRYVIGKIHVARSKVKVTVSTYSLCTGLNETYLCPAHNCRVGPALGMVQYSDLVFHPFLRSHQGAILLKVLGGGVSVLWTHFFPS